MPIGQTIQATGLSSPSPYYSPWGGRGGNGALFVAHIIQANLTATGAQLEIFVETKNSDQIDADMTQLGAFSPVTSVGSSPVSIYLAGMLELYRYRYEVKGDPADDWIHFRMLRPSWVTN